MLIVIADTEEKAQHSMKRLLQTQGEVAFHFIPEAELGETRSLLRKTVYTIPTSSSGGGAVLSFPARSGGATGFDRSLPDQMDELEARLVKAAMGETKNNQVKAAKLLKITRGALQYKLKKYMPEVLQPRGAGHGGHESDESQAA